MKTFFASALIALSFSTLMTFPLNAQTTSVQLPTADTLGNFRVLSNTGDREENSRTEKDAY